MKPEVVVVLAAAEPSPLADALEREFKVRRIDLAAARARGIAVADAADATAPDVADLAIGLLLAVARRLIEGDAFVRAGRWSAGPMGFGTRVGGKKLGIVGSGAVGRLVAARAEGFDLEIAYHGPRPKADARWRHVADLVQLAREVDFLAVCCRDGPETRNLVDRRVLDALGPRGVLVSVARGGVVDLAALAGAVAEGAIAGVGLVAFEDGPRLPPELLARDDVVVAAHDGAFTQEARARMIDGVLASLRAHFAGRPPSGPVTGSARS